MEAQLSCPHCRKSFSVPLAEMTPGATRPCPSCGSIIKFAGDDASKIQSIVDGLNAEMPGVHVKVKVKTRPRPWWKFW